MGMNRVTQFWDHIRSLNYAETIEAADEISAFIRAEEDIDRENVARALSDAAEGKPTIAKRGGS